MRTDRVFHRFRSALRFSAVLSPRHYPESHIRLSCAVALLPQWNASLKCLGTCDFVRCSLWGGASSQRSDDLSPSGRLLSGLCFCQPALTTDVIPAREP